MELKERKYSKNYWTMINEFEKKSNNCRNKKDPKNIEKRMMELESRRRNGNVKMKA